MHTPYYSAPAAKILARRMEVDAVQCLQRIWRRRERLHFTVDHRYRAEQATLCGVCCLQTDDV